MKRFQILFISIFLSLSLYSQNLNFRTKHSIRKELKDILREDQRYRGDTKVNFLTSDSLMKLQTDIDSINKVKLIAIVKQHGYPSFERIKCGDAFVLLLHLTYEKDFNDLENLFRKELKKGNMPPREFGTWYDRCRMNMGKKSFYGCYGNKEFTESEKIEINKNRKEIGLKVI